MSNLKFLFILRRVYPRLGPRVCVSVVNKSIIAKTPNLHENRGEEQYNKQFDRQTLRLSHGNRARKDKNSLLANFRQEINQHILQKYFDLIHWLARNTTE